MNLEGCAKISIIGLFIWFVGIPATLIALAVLVIILSIIFGASINLINNLLA